MQAYCDTVLHALCDTVLLAHCHAVPQAHYHTVQALRNAVHRHTVMLCTCAEAVTLCSQHIVRLCSSCIVT